MLNRIWSYCDEGHATLPNYKPVFWFLEIWIRWYVCAGY